MPSKITSIAIVAFLGVSRRWLWPCLLLVLFSLNLTGQRKSKEILGKSDMKILGNYRNIELPFSIENDFIVIDVLLDRRIPLRFIIDTGAENTVLLEKSLTDLLNVDYQRTFTVRGSDATTELTAYLATGIDLELANRLLARNRSMLVLEENYFDFEQITGVNIHGILGVDFLMRFTCQFDFKRNVMILHEPNRYKPSGRHVEVPAEFIRNRAYLKVPVSVSQPAPTPRRLLLDSGAGLSLLLHTYSDSVMTDLPVQSIPAYIASGLGGSLEGSVGRSRLVEIGGKGLEGVITYFQPLDTLGLAFLNGREGIIGNRIMKRFNVVINFTRKKVYFRPDARRWKRKFRYDRSGMAIIAGGKNLRKFTVASVVPGSPADEAGLKIGDRLVGINGKSVGFMTLGGITARLQGKVGRQIKVRFKRGKEYTVVRFRLRDLI